MITQASNPLKVIFLYMMKRRALQIYFVVVALVASAVESYAISPL